MRLKHQNSGACGFASSVLIVMCLCCAAARAQYRFDSWTTDDGLPQNSVYSIVQTPDGYLWMTTLDGLARFDGVRFTVFNRNSRTHLPSNRFINLFAEDDGTLWICTEENGLARYRAGEFQTFTTADGLTSNRVFEVQKDADGSLLIFTPNGINRFRNERFTVEERNDFLEYRFYAAPSGANWEIDRSGLRMKKDGSEERYALPFAADKISGERTFNYFSFVEMLEDRSGALWMAAAGNLYRLKNGEMRIFTEQDGMPPSLVRSLAQSREGNIWLGTEKEGVCRLADDRFRCFGSEKGLSSDTVYSIFFDRENTLWIATAAGGINRVSRQIVTTLSTADGLPDKNVYPILEDRAGAIWLGAFGSLAKYDGGKLSSYKPGDGLLYELIQSLYEDRDGRLWIGSLGGIEILENGKFTDFTGKLGLPVGGYDFWDIHETGDGAFWFATNKGVVKYDGAAATVLTTADGLPGNDVKAILEARDGSLWFGTYDGLANLKDGKFTVFGENEGLAGNHVRSLYEDDAGTLWIGTYDAGLSRLKDGKLTNYTTAEGLFSNGVFAIIEDAASNFWMSSNQGIYRVSRRELNDFADGRIPLVTSTAFGKSDGMLNSEANGGRQPAGIRARDGRLWFPTQDGAAIVDPQAVRVNPLAPPVVIESIKIDNIEQSAARDGQSAIEIQPAQNNLEIAYTGLSFIKPEQIRFRYRMEGLDETWTEAGGRRAVYYTRLPPGDYTFRVIAANSDNVWNETGASLKITVLPPFYRTWWFVALAVLSVSAIAFYAYRHRVGQLQKKNELQQMYSGQMIQSQERERKRIAVELHDSLGQQLLVIKNWALLELAARGENNQSREALSEISGAASEAIEEVREIIYDLRPYQLDKIGLTKTITFMIEKVAAASGIKFKTRIDPIDETFDYEAEITFYRIVQECLNNIVKHSGASRAAVSIENDGQTVKLTIEDNGRGFAPDDVGGESKQKGFGLTGIGERVRMLGGERVIVSAPDEGTKIAVSIPLAKNKRTEKNK